MDIVIYSAFQLYGECLESCLKPQHDVAVVAVVQDAGALRAVLERVSIDLLLVDVSPGIAALDVSSITDDHPGLVSMALGLAEQDADVLQCGRAGFAGYVPRDASLQALVVRMRECLDGRLTCPPSIAASLLRALHADDDAPAYAPAVSLVAPAPSKLSPREVCVARLLRRGLSNKEIARDLDISVATVKHHVHSILEKLELPGRVHVARAQPDASWGLGAPARDAGIHALKRA